MRNSPPPLAAIFPDGIPEGISRYVNILISMGFEYIMGVNVFTCRRRVNIDMSNIPDDQEYADTVFVDSANKVYSIDK